MLCDFCGIMHELYSTLFSIAVLDYFKLGYFDNLVKFIPLNLHYYIAASRPLKKILTNLQNQFKK
jgi:hypothetical protein